MAVIVHAPHIAFAFAAEDQPTLLPDNALPGFFTELNSPLIIMPFRADQGSPKVKLGGHIAPRHDTHIAPFRRLVKRAGDSSTCAFLL